eukprot:jgi/Psemu1/5234/gm1.5234_g
MRNHVLFTACALSAIGSALAFVPVRPTSSIPATTTTTTTTTTVASRTQTALFSSENDNDNKKKGGLDGSMRNKLLTESIAPWRTLRLFLYGSLGSGAFVGGLINGSGAIANSASPDFNLQTENAVRTREEYNAVLGSRKRLLESSSCVCTWSQSQQNLSRWMEPENDICLVNLGIDFGFVVLMGFAAKYDIDKQAELQSKVDEKIQRKKEQKAVTKAMKERESILQALPLEITVGADGATQTARVADLQRGAKQHMIIVAGPRKACKDALIGANLLKMDFALSNVLVVPYETDGGDSFSRPSGGFGDKPSYETQPYIARASGEDWEDYIQQEIADAIEQNGDNVKTEGIAIVVANTGSIIRRGVGTVPWRRMVEELEETVNPTTEEKGLFGLL